MIINNKNDNDYRYHDIVYHQYDIVYRQYDIVFHDDSTCNGYHDADNLCYY